MNESKGEKLHTNMSIPCQGHYTVQQRQGLKLHIWKTNLFIYISLLLLSYLVRDICIIFSIFRHLKMTASGRFSLYIFDISIFFANIGIFIKLITLPFLEGYTGKKSN